MASPLETQENYRLGFFSSLAYPDFRRLWTGAVFSQSGVWALIVARAALSLEMTGSLAWVGNVTFAAMIPSFLLGPIGGYLADRYDRRSILITAFALAVVINLVLAILVAGGAVREAGDIWYLLILSAVHGCVRALQLPATQSLLPNVVPSRNLLNAVALNQAAQQGARMTGPLLMLPFIFIVGPYWAFFISPMLFLLALTQAISIKTASRGATAVGKTVLYNMVEGIRYVYTHPMILSIVLLTVVHCAFTMAFESLIPMFARDELGMKTGSSLYGGASYLMAGVGTGALVATMALARVQSQKNRGSILFLVGMSSGIAPLAFAFAPNLPLAMMATAGMGASTAAFMALSNATIQSLVPDGVRGRIMGVNMWHIVGAMAMLNLVNGHLGDVSWISAPIILTTSGLLFAAIMAGSLLRMPLREIYLRGVPAPAYAT